MTDQQAILQAILADPSDDLPRLAYADYCEEHDDPARAELIRIQLQMHLLSSDHECGQCRAARMGGQTTNGPCRCTKEWRKLRNRHLKLLTTENILKWLKPMPNIHGCFVERHGRDYGWTFKGKPGGQPKVYASFNRGFVWKLVCNGNDWVTYADSITQQQPIEQVFHIPNSPTVIWEYIVPEGTVKWFLENRTADEYGIDVVASESVEVPFYCDNLSGRILVCLLRHNWPKIKFL